MSGCYLKPDSFIFDAYVSQRVPGLARTHLGAVSLLFEGFRHNCVGGVHIACSSEYEVLFVGGQGGGGGLGSSGECGVVLGGRFSVHEGLVQGERVEGGGGSMRLCSVIGTLPSTVDVAVTLDAANAAVAIVVAIDIVVIVCIAALVAAASVLFAPSSSSPLSLSS